MTISQTAPVTDEELDQMIWKLERDGMTPKMLSLMRELREVRRAKGEPVARELQEHRKAAATPIYQLFDMGWYDTNKQTHDNAVSAGCAGRIVYAAQPAPVVPGVIATDDISYSVGRFRTHRDCYRDGWNACRAAMLNHSGDAADMVEPVSNRDELPPNSFTNEELAGMAHGNNPQANAYRELLAYRINSPATPDGWVMVPMKLTAENGAKAALIGEFNLEYTLTCHECFGDGCDDCSGEGAWINTIPIDWTTIKEIWAKGVEHFAVAPQEVKGE